MKGVQCCDLFRGIALKIHAFIKYFFSDIMTKRQLAMRVQEHLSGNSGKSAIHEHFCSCRDCHSCSIRNFYTLAQANTDFEVKMKEALHIESIHQN